MLVAKAVIVLAQALKSRDADHLTNLIYDPKGVTDADAAVALAAARQGPHDPILQFAYDVHTGRGRRQGKTREDFLVTAFDALNRRAPGLFDEDLEALRRAMPKAQQVAPHRRGFGTGAAWRTPINQRAETGRGIP